MIDWLGACFRDLPAERRLGSGPVDPLGRQQIAQAARLLRSIRPCDGDVEILLHEMARTLERVAETGSASGGQIGVSQAELTACAVALT